MALGEIVEFVQKAIPIALVVIGIFATLATLTPNKTDDKIVQFLLSAINFLGGNIGKAKNEEG